MESTGTSRRSYLKRRTRGEKVFSVFNVILMVFLVLMVFYPFWYAIIYSFDTPADASLGGLFLFPRAFTFNNYYVFMKDSKIFIAFG